MRFELGNLPLWTVTALPTGHGVIFCVKCLLVIIRLGFFLGSFLLSWHVIGTKLSVAHFFVID